MYILTTPTGYVMKFYVAGVAKLYRNLYGGEVVYIQEESETVGA